MSLKIVHTFGRHAGAAQTLDKDVVRFGRDPSGDVVFDADFDRDASGHHAEAHREAAGWVLVDLQSRNGTFVNGERVDRRLLKEGDEITFGAKGPRVRVEIDAKEAGPAPYVAASSSASLPRPAPRAGQSVGQRTIAALISSAVATARSSQPKMSTRVLNDYVDRQVGAATAGHRRTARVLTVLFVASLAGLGGLLWWTRSSSDEIDRLRADLANLAPNDPRRKDIESRLGSLHPANASFGRNLYDQNKKGIFMLAAGGQGFCTAFAVRPSVLATNAHCVAAAKQHGSGVVAVENEGRGQVSFAITETRPHPGYHDNDAKTLTPDVGTVTISGRSAVVLTLATPQELAKLGPGDDVYLIGFPGRLMDASNPAATFLGAHVGRITNSAGRPGAFAESWLVQHDAPTTHGTSGSPIFNSSGHVIAINAGGYLEGDEETVSGRKTEVVRASPYKFGMRIDLINAILR